MKPVLSRCNLCQTQVKFKSIEADLGGTFKQYGFPYSLADFETLSYKKYACPNCGSSDRDRLYKLYLSKYLASKKSVRLLDFAPSEPLRNYLKDQPNVKYRSADLMMEGVDDKIDITDMKEYADGSFDFFISSHVVEHVSDDSKAFRELYRVLSPGGKGILMTPIIDRAGVFDEDTSVQDTAERWRRFAQDDHVRLYEKSIFLKRVKAAGFTIEQLGRKQLGWIAFAQNGITPKSVLYVVGKGSVS